MSATETQIEFEDMDIDEKLNMLYYQNLELAEKQDEILEKLDNLNLSGDGYSVFES